MADVVNIVNNIMEIYPDEENIVFRCSGDNSKVKSIESLKNKIVLDSEHLNHICYGTYVFANEFDTSKRVIFSGHSGGHLVTAKSIVDMVVSEFKIDPSEEAKDHINRASYFNENIISGPLTLASTIQKVISKFKFSELEKNLDGNNKGCIVVNHPNIGESRNGRKSTNRAVLHYKKINIPGSTSYYLNILSFFPLIEDTQPVKCLTTNL